MARIKPKFNSGILFLFILWPFASFLMALRSFHLRENRIVVYAFMGLFGFTFVLGNEGMDSFSYAKLLEETALHPFNQFYNIVSGLYTTETSLDIMMPLVNFIISRVTSDYRALFGVWALIFGYFYIKSIGKVHVSYSVNKNLNSLFFLILFIIFNPITNINGFRMWTAAWIFFYGAYHVVLFRDKKYLLLSLLAVLFHFSFISANVILISYMILGNRNVMFYILVVASFILPEISLGYVETLSKYFSEGISERAIRYTSDATITNLKQIGEDAKARGAWYLSIPKITMHYYMIFAFFFVKFKFNKLTKSPHLQNIFSFAMLFLAFTNFAGVIPSMSRFSVIFYLFASVFIVMVFAQIKSNRIHPLTLIGFIPLILSLIIQFRMLFDVLNPWLLGPMPMAFIFTEDSVYKILFK
jgi:hypothetical protein